MYLILFTAAVLIGTALVLIAVRGPPRTHSPGQPSPHAQPAAPQTTPLPPRQPAGINPTHAGMSPAQAGPSPLAAELAHNDDETLEERLKATVPDGLTMVSTFQDREPVRPGVLTPLALYVADKEAMAEIQAALGPGSSVDELHNRCNAAFIARGGRTNVSTTWSVIIDVESLRGVARIRSAEVEPDHWPATFDAEMKDCYLQAFIGVEYPGGHDYHHIAEYPLCVYGGDALSDSPKHSPAFTQE